MPIDERVIGLSQGSITVDGADVPRPKGAAALAWGSTFPDFANLKAGDAIEPLPGVAALAEILAPVIFTPEEREQHFDGLCRFLATLPPPDVSPEITIRANELRQHSGVPIVPETPPLPPLIAPPPVQLHPPPLAPGEFEPKSGPKA